MLIVSKCIAKAVRHGNSCGITQTCAFQLMFVLTVESMQCKRSGGGAECTAIVMEICRKCLTPDLESVLECLLKLSSRLISYIQVSAGKPFFFFFKSFLIIKRITYFENKSYFLNYIIISSFCTKAVII